MPVRPHWGEKVPGVDVRIAHRIHRQCHRPATPLIDVVLEQTGERQGVRRKSAGRGDAGLAGWRRHGHRLAARLHDRGAHAAAQERRADKNGRRIPKLSVSLSSCADCCSFSRHPANPIFVESEPCTCDVEPLRGTRGTRPLSGKLALFAVPLIVALAQAKVARAAGDDAPRDDAAPAVNAPENATPENPSRENTPLERVPPPATTTTRPRRRGLLPAGGRWPGAAAAGVADAPLRGRRLRDQQRPDRASVHRGPGPQLPRRRRRRVALAAVRVRRAAARQPDDDRRHLGAEPGAAAGGQAPDQGVARRSRRWARPGPSASPAARR